MWRCDGDIVNATILTVRLLLTNPITFVGFFQVANVNIFFMLIHLLSYYCNCIRVSHYMQGVIRVRKRVTLMAATVTVMFGVCWVSDIIAHSVDYYTSLSTSKDRNSVIHTLILLNSAVNPFVYALINKTFRDKLKGMLYCSCAPSTGSFSPPAIVRHNAEFANKGYRQSSVGPSSSKWTKRTVFFFHLKVIKNFLLHGFKETATVIVTLLWPQGRKIVKVENVNFFKPLILSNFVPSPNT